jgi:predicted site-specific integrase-resolvase
MDQPTTTRRRSLATPEQVAKHLQLPPATLKKWRTRGTGPRYHRVGKHVRYAWHDVEAWMVEQRRGGVAA